MVVSRLYLARGDETPRGVLWHQHPCTGGAAGNCLLNMIIQNAGQEAGVGVAAGDDGDGVAVALRVGEVGRCGQRPGGLGHDPTACGDQRHRFEYGVFGDRDDFVDEGFELETGTDDGGLEGVPGAGG